jgi:hypothetical protein
MARGFKTMEIRYDKDGNPTDSLGNPLIGPQKLPYKPGNNKQTKKDTGWFPGKHLATGIGRLGGGAVNTAEALARLPKNIRQKIKEGGNPFTNQTGLFQGGEKNRVLGRFRDAMEGGYQQQRRPRSMADFPLHSPERKAEYDRRNWAYDDTIKGGPPQQRAEKIPLQSLPAYKIPTTAWDIYNRYKSGQNILTPQTAVDIGTSVIPGPLGMMLSMANKAYKTNPDEFNQNLQNLKNKASQLSPLGMFLLQAGGHYDKITRG